MDLKVLLSHLKSKWRRYLIFMLFFTLLPFFIFKIKKVIEIRSEEWIRKYLKTNVRLDIDWEGWKLDLVSYNLNITGLRIKRVDADKNPFWMFAERIELHLNPFSFFKDKTIDVRSVKIEGMKGNLVISDPKGLDELKSLGRTILFMDDSLNANREYAKELFVAMIPLGKHWFSQASLGIAEDQELLDLASRSGCKGLFIGFLLYLKL